MCLFSVFNFVCGVTKLKIVAPCPEYDASSRACRNDPVAHVEDGRNGLRTFAQDTYGPGICSNVHCRQFFGLIPPNEYHRSDIKDLTEDDEPFVMDDNARAEREDRWYRQMLSTSQQFQLLGTTFPLDPNAASPYAKYVLGCDWTVGEYEDPRGLNADPDLLDWRELNPRYLNEYALWICTSHLLPASVTDTRVHDHQTSSPFQPAFGPFKIKSHTCKPSFGVCKKCGRFHGKESGRKVRYEERDWATSNAALPLPEEVFLPHTKRLSPPTTPRTSTAQMDPAAFQTDGEQLVEFSDAQWRAADNDQTGHRPLMEGETDESGDTVMFED